MTHALIVEGSWVTPKKAPPERLLAGLRLHPSPARSLAARLRVSSLTPGASCSSRRWWRALCSCPTHQTKKKYCGWTPASGFLGFPFSGSRQKMGYAQHKMRSHHLETMVEVIVCWYLQTKSWFRGFLGGAGLHPSTVMGGSILLGENQITFGGDPRPY